VFTYTTRSRLFLSLSPVFLSLSPVFLSLSSVSLSLQSHPLSLSLAFSLAFSLSCFSIIFSQCISFSLTVSVLFYISLFFHFSPLSSLYIFIFLSVCFSLKLSLLNSHSPCVNFINVKRTNFLYKRHFSMYMLLEKSCQNDVRTKNTHI